MSTSTALKFGPEWLRTLSGGGSPPNGPTGSLPHKLAMYRYGREEMLTLYQHNLRPPQAVIEKNRDLIFDKPEAPMLLRDITDDEERLWQYGINSDAVLRLVGKGGSSDRGRGRSRAIPFTKRSPYDDEFCDPRSKSNLSSMRGRSFERAQSFHDRPWSGDSSNVQEEWSGPNKERSSRDNWRFSGTDDGWRPPTHKHREPKSNWRYTNDWGSGKGEEGRERSWSSSHSLSDRDPLPDWSTTDNVESVGRFDDGAFHDSEGFPPPSRPDKTTKDRKKKPSESKSDKQCSSVGENEESSQDDNMSDDENESSHNERPSPQPQRDKVEMTVDKTQVPKLPLNIPPSKIQDEHMSHLVSKIVDEDTETRWFYQDPQGDIQGPFKCSEMAEWYNLGYFSQSLLVRKEGDEGFVQLGDLAKQCGDVPFASTTTTTTKPQSTSPTASQSTTVPAAAHPPEKIAQLLQQQLLQQQQQELLRQQFLQQQFLRQQVEAQQVLLKLQQMDGWNNFTAEQKQQLLAQHLVTQQLSTPPGVGLGAKPAGLGVVSPLQQLFGLPPVIPTSEDIVAPTSVPPIMKIGDTPVENHLLKDPVQQLMMQMRSNSLIKNLPTDDPQALTDPVQVLMRQLLQPTPQQQQDEAEERRREEERIALEKERIKLQEEKKRFEEERKKQEELRRQEDQKRMEELMRIEELRKQEEMRIREEEERKQEEQMIKEKMRLEEEMRLEEIRRKEIEAKKALDKMKREEERWRKEEQNRLALEEKERRRQEEMRLRQEEAQRQELEEKRLEEERLLREERERKLLEAKQAEALRRLQEQQMKANLPAWGQTANTQPSLIQIQRMQQDAVDKQSAERVLKQQQEYALQQEQQMREQQFQQPAAKMNAHMRWATNSSPPSQQPVKSLAEIQAEEAEKLAKEQEMEQEKNSQMSVPVAGIWGSASSKLSWANQKPWGNATSAPAPPSTSLSGFWDDPPLNKASGGKKSSNAGMGKSNPSIAGNRGNKNNKAIKQEEEKLNKLFQKQIQKQSDKEDEFNKWCSSMLSNWPGQVDIPTFVPFLLDVESPYEVHDYVRNYLGDSKAVREFAKQFLEKRSRYRNQKGKQASDNILVPAPANQPHTEFQEAKSKNKKKKKMQKVDSSLLGFNVTANPERFNVGERDFVEGM